MDGSFLIIILCSDFQCLHVFKDLQILLHVLKVEKNFYGDEAKNIYYSFLTLKNKFTITLLIQSFLIVSLMFSFLAAFHFLLFVFFSWPLFPPPPPPNMCRFPPSLRYHPALFPLPSPPLQLQLP
ncbi:hypothetical protein ILYODFUR_025804 [Ilyodon furcidens]|uniref:Uncharacterized protein n=1 Tax=Ilyodon furcidens TaxID=33524 RepID=A0ABV0TE18_9TELE